MSVMYKNGSSWSNLMLQAYPVGAVYISYSATPPASLFGGTWTAITGYFPYFNAGTSTGGSNSHTLSNSEMPSHRHQLQMEACVRTQSGAGLWYPANAFQDRAMVSHLNAWPTYQESYTSSVGSGTAFSTMPAYQTFYAWRRTA